MPTLPSSFRVLVLASCCGYAMAQVPVQGVPSTPAVRAVRLVAPLVAAESAPQEPVAEKPPATPEAAAAMAVAKGRFEKFKTLAFDRRPSSILQAWVAPELKPYDPAEEEAKKKAAAANGGAVATDGQAAPSEPSGLTREQMEQELVKQFGQPPSNAGPAPDPAAVAAAAAAAKEQELKDKTLQREFEMLQRDVTLGRWSKVAGFFGTLAEADRKPAYEHFLRAVMNHPQGPEDQRVPPNLQEKNRFSFQDVLALAGIAPGGFDKKQSPMLAPLVSRAMEAGSVVEELVRLLGEEVKKPAAEQRLDRREAAMLLTAIKRDTELGAFLPTAEEAEQQNDREALNLLARYALAMYDKEKRTAYLETAWRVTQAALAKGEISDEDKAEALRRAVELAPRVSTDLGPTWLAESFTTRPDRGMEIIAAIGGQVAKGFQEKAQDADYRASGLKLQKTAVEALLKVAPQLAEQWRPTLALLAAGWIVEASYSYTNSQSDTMGPVMQRDEYGNIFYGNMRRGGGGQVIAVEPADLLDAQPGPGWAALLDDSLLPHFLTISAQLCLKVNEPERAFPFIEQLAEKNQRKAKELADEFLRVWTRDHNPNSNRTNSYMFMYGFEQRANGIPLTRSKQERNLAELADWVAHLRKLPIEGGVDQKLLTEAFVAAHSTAEVYQLDTLQKVFGDFSTLDPVLLAELLGKMRTNLATVWRTPSVQEEAKTKRSQKEMLQEVAYGYDTALTIAQQALKKRGKHWALLGVVASILHDKNNFAKEQQNDSKFSEQRRMAFDLFKESASSYAEIAGDLRLDQETIAPFDTWFYAALGASDLGAIDEDTVVAKSQLPLIRAAIDALPKSSRERHLGMFANALFTRMSAVKPQIKYRYLEAGFEIVGDNPQAREAKKVWDYYKDLMRELRLEAVVDGPTEVGTEPFGVRIDIVHSPEIERESGGFQKYATNQNNLSYAYNYGRPLENYRDRFQEAVTTALQEHFEVLSVTFNGEAMTSKRTDDPAWRQTSYAWLLLKARGPQVDRIPVMQIDFDFIDTSGYTVLPIGTTPVVIDASAKPAQRPFKDVEVTQILDQRKADEGKITLEIKAKATGLVPDLDTLLQLDTPGFQIKKRDDQGAAVVQFTEDQSAIKSERVWLLALEPKGSGARPQRFVFGKPRDEETKAVYQRYSDADLETVSPEVALSGVLRAENPLWAWILVGVAFVAYLIWFFRKPSSSGGKVDNTLSMPQHVTPFTVLGLLRQVAARKLDDGKRRALAADIARIEARHFGRADDPSLDLVAVATTWLQRVR